MNRLSAIVAALLVLVFLHTCGAVFATTVEVLSVSGGAVTMRIDGRTPKTFYSGDLTPEGVYVQGLTRTGEANLRIRGINEVVAPGRTVVAAPNVAGLPALNIPKDVDGKFIAQFLLLNQPFQIEIDPKSPGGLLLPTADAERLQLPYKDPPLPKDATPEQKKRKSEFSRPAKRSFKGKPFYDHYTVAKSVKVGGIELFGVKTTVSEHPELKRAVAGRAFLTLMDTTWEGSTMTVRRLP
jgi:hypothetical protein